jgi:hypothetical protein
MKPRFVHADAVVIGQILGMSLFVTGRKKSPSSASPASYGAFLCGNSLSGKDDQGEDIAARGQDKITAVLPAETLQQPVTPSRA